MVRLVIWDAIVPIMTSLWWLGGICITEQGPGNVFFLTSCEILRNASSLQQLWPHYTKTVMSLKNHDMETLSVLRALCPWNPSVNSGCSVQRTGATERWWFLCCLGETLNKEPNSRCNETHRCLRDVSLMVIFCFHRPTPREKSRRWYRMTRHGIIASATLNT